MDDHVLPLTINRDGAANSYLCSPRAHYVAYAREEMRLSRGRLPVSFRVLTGLGGLALDVAGAHRIVHVDNWLASAGPGPSWPVEETGTIIDALATHFADSVIGFRALNERHHREHLAALSRAGCLLVPARRISIFPTADPGFRAPRNLKQDLRTLERGWNDGITVAEEIGPCDYGRMAELYRALNQTAYTPLNPAYTASYFGAMHRHGLMSFLALRDPNGKLAAFHGYFLSAPRVIVSPIVGYDLAVSRKVGLYRMLGAAFLRLALARRLDLNAGAGAEGFKRRRGAEAVLEYNAYYVAHLTLRQRAVFALFARALDRLAPGILSRLGRSD
jgi:hypothetical protein